MTGIKLYYNDDHTNTRLVRTAIIRISVEIRLITIIVVGRCMYFFYIWNTLLALELIVAVVSDDA
jgi:dolichyl-phosphate-mannose--protein O-mannosyl transferase